MYEPDLHLFINDDEILGRTGLSRMVQTLRRESAAPVLAQLDDVANHPLGYCCAARDESTGAWRLWGCSLLPNEPVFLAVSDDAGVSWQRKGPIALNVKNAGIGCLGLMPPGPDVDDWFRDAAYAGFVQFSAPPVPLGNVAATETQPGIHAVRARDEGSIDIRFPAILPYKGDRTAIGYDPQTGEYSLVTRPYFGFLPGLPKEDYGDTVKCRMARMWKSRSLLDWEDCGIVLRCDDLDAPDSQVYGLIPFRYGPGFLAFVEIYHQALERLDTELAWSPDGRTWQRVEPRQPVLPLGGEGAWDSHWVVPANNAPLAAGDRLRILYMAARTKHGSKARHRTGLGLASIRKDGWVSLEAGRTEGTLVTAILPLQKPMELELNVNAYSGHVAVDVIPMDAGGRCFDPLPGYDTSASRIEHVDAVHQPIRWGEHAVVDPVEAGHCVLRIHLRQGSLFSYRWTEAA